MRCATCGGTDHSRSSSSHCKFHKPPIRKRKFEAGEKYDTYTIKHGLNKFFRKPLDENIRNKLKNRIFEDVKVVSRLMIETSYFICAFYKYYHTHMPDKRFSKLDVEQFTYILKGSAKCTIDDPLNFIQKYMKEIRQRPFYDGKLRTYIIQEACTQYKTNFNNNVTTHMFRRMKKFIQLLKIEKSPQVIHDTCFNYYYNNDTSTKNNITKTLDGYGLRKNLVEKNPIAYINFLFDLQAIQNAKSVRTCAVFPILRQSVKHIRYTTMGLYELLRAIGVKVSCTDVRDNALEHWRRYFNVPGSAASFGCSFTTDGIVVCKSMNRPVRVSESPLKNSRLSHQRVIAVDPGAKTPIVTCDDSFSYKMLSKQRVAFEQGQHVRKKKLKKWTAEVEDDIRNRLENTEELSFKNEHYLDMIKFNLKFFDRKQKCRERKNVIRLGFDKYIRTQKAIHRIIREFFVDEGGPTLILYGNGVQFINTTSFRGHGKFFHNSVIKFIKVHYKNQLTLQMVDESYTTKTCSMCQQMDGLKVSTGGHRYVYCSICRSGIHRDKNAAKNILLKYMFGLPSSTEQ